jgi:hypothetical protein
MARTAALAKNSHGSLFLSASTFIRRILAKPDSRCRTTTGVCALHICLVFTAILVAPRGIRSQTLTAREPLPYAAVPAILSSLERYPVVALGEDHRNQQIHDFIVSLVSASDFPNRVNDIVVEFGAARYQELVDRYIAGEAIPPDQLCRVWRDTVNILVWDAPVYQRFFETVRAVNQKIAQRRRLRVLLGDPVFDWSQVQTHEQWERLAVQRDSHALKVIDKEVLEKGHRALLIFGSSHLMRERAYGRYGGNSKEKPNLTELLEKNHPGILFAIWSHTGNWGEVSEADARLASWPAPSLALFKGTWLGLTAVGEQRNSPRMQELADGFLYLGPVRLQTESRPIDTVYADPSYLSELLRRDRIQGGHNKSELQRLMRSVGSAHEQPQ